MICFDGKKIHFIGIGGVGVNALARCAMDNGARVSGSDAKINTLCRDLVVKGADIYEGTNASKVDYVDEVVYSSAIKYDNAELVRARELNIPIFERHEFLRKVAGNFDKVVGIAGTHGKTTTTAMLAHILVNCGRHFVGMIGGESVDFGNYVNNSSDGEILVVEACEYKRNFLALNPTLAVVTNVECDHPDCYADISEVRDAFDEYLSGAPIKIYAEGEDLDGYRVYIKTPTESTKYMLKSIGPALFKDGEPMGNIILRDGGEYNLKNAAIAIAAADVLGINAKCSIRALSSFGGVKRRFEYGGNVDGVPAYFDFAHHPTEIRCVLERASEYGKILAVFQPHTYSRTKAYFEDFAEVFGGDKNIGALVIMPTYAARENPCCGCESDTLARHIVTRYGKDDTYLAKNASETVDFVNKYAKSHDVILFIGAGDIYDIKAKIAN